VSTALNLGVTMRRIVTVAALVALLPLAAAAQPTSAAGHERAYAAAQAEYEVGHYAAAFTAFAALADAGHVESARIAMQMHRHGPGLYQMRFAAGPKQIGRWTALVSCRSQAAATTDACLSVAGADASARR
jgi:hypothetical protein